MRRVVRVIVAVLLALAVLANGALAVALLLTQEPAPTRLTAERVASASKPAIVLVQSNYTIATSMPQPTVNQPALRAKLQQMIDSGQITNQAQLDRAWYQLIFANPDAYLTAGATVPDTWYDGVTGSGFFVTEDGYLVTAAHVVTKTKAAERSGIIDATKSDWFVAQLKASLGKAWAPYVPNDTQLSTMVDFWQRWYANYLSIDKIDAKFSLGSGASVDSGQDAVNGGISASVVSIDPAQGGHDIAIMKADITSMPALALARGDPHMGDATYAIGYPGTASIQQKNSNIETFRITVTVGTIQRMRSQTGSDGSTKVYGTDAALAHGDSGGPVVDARGDVMGVMSFIVPDANGNQLPGQGYFVPSSFIREDLAKANVTIAPDPTRTNLTDTYYRALAKGDNRRYKEELSLLRSIQSRSAMDVYVAVDISRTRAEIAAGNDTTPPDLSGYAVPAAGSGAGVILIALVSWLVLALAAQRPLRVDQTITT